MHPEFQIANGAFAAGAASRQAPSAIRFFAVGRCTTVSGAPCTHDTEMAAAWCAKNRAVDPCLCRVSYRNAMPRTGR